MPVDGEPEHVQRVFGPAREVVETRQRHARFGGRGLGVDRLLEEGRSLRAVPALQRDLPEPEQGSPGFRCGGERFLECLPRMIQIAALERRPAPLEEIGIRARGGGRGHLAGCAHGGGAPHASPARIDASASPRTLAHSPGSRCRNTVSDGYQGSVLPSSW